MHERSGSIDSECEVTATGSTVRVTDDDGEPTVYESDLAGRRTALVDPNSGTSTYTYDAKGQVSQIASATGTVTLTYDVLGRMTARTSIDATATCRRVHSGFMTLRATRVRWPPRRQPRSPQRAPSLW